MVRKFDLVQVGKIDLDTVGAAYLLGVTREDTVEVLRGNASEEALANPNILCIEVGGSGRVDEGNFDHHAEGGPEASATLQASRGVQPRADIQKLVEYIHLLDVEGPSALRARQEKGEDLFPTLSDVFAGMLLTERNPVEQLHKGIELLEKVIESKQDPFGRIEGFDSYAEAKRQNNLAIAKAVESAQWATTASGLRLGSLETEFFGSPGALYGAGAQVVVAFNPNFRGVRKFTVAGNSVRVDAVLPLLNEREPGWGGPPTGTIIGSPFEGSNLSLEEVVEIVRQTL